jgi:hypothetical protein
MHETFKLKTMHKENPQVQHTADNGNATLGVVSGSFITENDFGKDVNGLRFIDELGNIRECESVTYDDAGIPYIIWKGIPPIGSKCAYNLRYNKKMKWL